MTYFSYLKKQDKILGKIIKSKLPNLAKSDDIYFSLLESIVSQQLSSKVAEIIWKRFLDLFESNYPNIEQLVEKSETELRTAGLSKQKISYLKNVANFWKEYNLKIYNFDKHTDEEIIDLLSQIKGVGRWTVEMILIFTLGREDVFAIDDLGLFNAVTSLYELDKLNLSKKELKNKVLEISENWKPYRSYASRYLWKYYMEKRSTKPRNK